MTDPKPIPVALDTILANPSDADLHDICLTLRHDYGLLPDGERARLRIEAREWLWAMRHFIRERILATAEERRWVPVSERVPEEGEQVLVRGWGEGRKCHVFSLGERQRSSPNTVDWFDDDAEPLWFEAVDWMPLPAQPEV